MPKTDQEVLTQLGYDPTKFKMTRLPDGGGRVDPVDAGGFTLTGAAPDPVSERQIAQSNAQAMDPRLAPQGLEMSQAHSQYADPGKFSAAQVYGTGVAQGVPPMVAGLVTGGLVNYGLQRAGVSSPWGLAAGAGIGAVAGGIGTQLALNELRTPEEKLRLEAMAAQHPRAFQFGELTPNVIAMRPSLSGLQGTARYFGNVAGVGARNAGALAAATGDAAHVVNTALGAGTVAATRGPEVYRNLTGDQPVDWQGLVIDSIAAATLNKPNELTGKVVNKVAGRKLLPDSVEDGAYIPQKAEALRKGAGDQAFPTREEQLKIQEDQEYATRFAKAKAEADALAAEEAKVARESELANLEAANERRRQVLKEKPELADAADQLQAELDKANGVTAGNVKPKVTTAEALGKPVADAPTPDAPQTVDAQVAAALDPESTRKVVLFTEGQDAPDAIDGLTPVVLTNGKTAFYNPRKWAGGAKEARKAVLAADREQFDATLLGMSQSAKPADASAVVTTSKPGAPNVQAEVVGPEGVQAATAAGQAAVPGGRVEVKPAGAVEAERAKLSSATPESFNTDAAAVPQGQQATFRLANALADTGVDTRIAGSPTELYDLANPDVSYHGRYDQGVKTPEGEVPPAVTSTTARADTLPHEAMHVAWDRFDAKQREKFTQGLMADPEYQAAVRDEPGLTPEEFVARHGSVDLLRRITSKDWGFWKNVGATWRVFRGQGTKADVMRQLGNMLAASPDKAGGGITYRAFTDAEIEAGKREPVPTPEPFGPPPTYVPDFKAKFADPETLKIRSDEEADYPKQVRGLLDNPLRSDRTGPIYREPTPLGAGGKAYDSVEAFRAAQMEASGMTRAEVAEALRKDAEVGYAEQPQYSKAGGESTADPFTDRVFTTQTEKELRSGKPFGVQLAKDGTVASSVLVGRIAKLPKVEQELLAPFVQWANEKGNVNAMEAADWLKANGPRAEVKNYGMDREQSAAKKEYDRIRGELDTYRGLHHDIMKAIDNSTVEHEFVRTDQNIVRALQRDEITAAEAAKLRRLAELARQVVSEPYVPYADRSPTATHYYNSISPRPVDRPMPDWTATKGKRNLQRVDVVIPQSTTPRSAKEMATGDRPVLWRQDDLHENLPNTLGWAALQYETGPNGEKIAHVIEAQSRWGQERRNAEKIIQKQGGTKEDYSAIGTPDHPLLADYNRLILKAAIEQARKEGATHIAISDAETAMMTEMHDQSAGTVYRNPTTGETYEHNVGEPIQRQRLKELGYTEITRKVDQEPGMRFNYDGRKGQLHKIAQEITRSAGEDISFGEHKNAHKEKMDDVTFSSYLDEESANARAVQLRKEVPGAEFYVDISADRYGDLAYNVKRKYVPPPREDLIFRNPDGTPKTTATGRLYPIAEPAARRAANEPFSFGGTRYSKANGGFSTLDRITNPEVEFAFRRAFLDRDHYTGKWSRAFIEDLTPREREIANTVRDKRLQLYRGTGTPVLTPEEQALSAKLTAHYTGIADEINAAGGKRVIKTKPNYESESIGPEAKHWLTAKGMSPESAAIEQAIADHWVDPTIAAKQGQAFAVAEAEKQARNYVNGLRGSNPDQDLSSHYGPLRKEAGFGLPANVVVNGKTIPIRDADAVRSLVNYGKRAARDFAFFKNVEEPHGLALNPSPTSKASDLTKDPYVVHALTAYRGRDVGAENVWAQRIHQAMRFASSAKLAAVAGVRNVIQLPVAAAPYVGKEWSVALKGIAEATTNYRDVLDRAITRGGFRRSQSDLAFDDNAYSTDRIAEFFGNAADMMGKWGGRGKLEEASRVVSSAQAELLAEIMLRKNDVARMRRFGVDAKDPFAREKLTLALTSAIEGTYDARELPVHWWGGNKTFEDIVSIFKWNIEKANTFHKDVLRPAVKDGNPVPLIVSLAAAAGISVPATKLLNEFINKRKAGPTWREINAASDITGKDYPMQRLAWATDVMNLAGVAGIYSTLANQAAQSLAGNSVHNMVFVAGNEVFLKDMVGAIAGYVEALNAGEDPVDAAGAMAKQLVMNMFQSGRAIMNQLPMMQDELQRKSEARDRSVYEQLVNEKQGPSNPATPNPAIGMREKEFKQTADIAQATELLEILTKRYFDKFADRPDLLKEKFDSLAKNPDRLFPSLEEDSGLGAARFIGYLNNVFGEDESTRRLREAAVRESLNKAKSEMVPKVELR